MIQITPRLGSSALLLRWSLYEEILVAHHLYSVSGKMCDQPIMRVIYKTTHSPFKCERSALKSIDLNLLFLFLWRLFWFPVCDSSVCDSFAIDSPPMTHPSPSMPASADSPIGTQ